MSTAFVILAAMLADNFLLSKFFGIETFFASSERKSASLSYGIQVIFVTTVAGSVSVLINKYVFVPLAIEFMSTFVTALVIIATVCAMCIVSKKISEKAYREVTKAVPLISTNCVVMGAVRLCTDSGLSVGASVLYLLAAGVGFAISLGLFSSVQERLENVSCVPCFKGLPILLLSAAFAAMAFAGFTGLGA